MTLKRTYQVPSRYTGDSKRARTLESQVNSLKKQVSKNKAELKYYDGYSAQTDTLSNRSIFTDVFLSDGTTSNNPTFIGRKVYVRKIELRVENSISSGTGTPGHGIIWREKRQGKTVDVNSFYPLNLDPEYHTLLRHWEVKTDYDKRLFHFVIDFGKQGRLVEFDEQTTATATGDIVRGDIRYNARTYLPVDSIPISFRVWYTDA